MGGVEPADVAMPGLEALPPNPVPGGLEPTTEEAERMVDIGSIFEWVPIRGIPREGLLTSLDLDPADPPRVLASISPEAFDLAVAELQLPAPAASALRAKVGLAWKTAGEYHRAETHAPPASDGAASC